MSEWSSLISLSPPHGLDISSGPSVGIHVVQGSKGPDNGRQPSDYCDLEDEAKDPRKNLSLQHERQPGKEEGNYVPHVFPGYLVRPVWFGFVGLFISPCP